MGCPHVGRVEIKTPNERVDFWSSPRQDQLGSTKCALRLLKKLCLSLLMSKNLKLKKVIKSFVPKPILCFSDSLCLFHIFISWSYIFEPVYITFTRKSVAKRLIETTIYIF